MKKQTAGLCMQKKCHRSLHRYKPGWNPVQIRITFHLKQKTKKKSDMTVGMTAGMFATTLEVADKVWRRSMRSRVNVGLTSLFNAFLKLFWEEAWSNRFLDLPTSSIGGIQDFLPSLFSLALNRLLVSTRGQRIATIKLG